MAKFDEFVAAASLLQNAASGVAELRVRMTAAEADIDDLQARMTTVEGLSLSVVNGALNVTFEEG